MTSYYSQNYRMEKFELRFDADKAILLCSSNESGKRQWAKKLNSIYAIGSVIEDNACFYISCESSDITGKYMALNKADGSTVWFIPGKAFMNVLFEGFLFLIFSDENNDFYMLKVDKKTGAKIWHHRVGNDLAEYSISRERILLTYGSGNKERLSLSKGAII